MQIDQVSWVVVADQQHVRIFEERRRGGVLHEMALGGVVDGHTRELDRRLGADGLAESRRRMHRVAALLAAAAHAKRFDRLVLIAPPRALGLLRAELDAPLQAHVAVESPHDYIDATPQSLRERLHDIRLERGQ